MGAIPLAPRQLRRSCDPQRLRFTTTAELPELEDLLGQQRALAALQLAVGVRRDGYNVYALGPAGLGKHGLAQRFVEQIAHDQPLPSDWCYVYNFDDARSPRALELPAGQANAFAAELDRLVQDLRVAITAALESDEYRARRDAIEEEFKDQQERGFAAIQERARQRDIALITTPAGIGFAPLREGEVIKPEAFAELPEERRKALEAELLALQNELQELMQQVPRRVREGRKRLEQLNREVSAYAVREPIAELRKRHARWPKLVAYLDSVERDVVDHAGDFLRSDESTGSAARGGERTAHALPGATPLARYRVKVLVDRAGGSGAPVVYEDNPSHANLIGQVEHVQQLGALITDFTLIKPGALHRANGGYLLLDARRLLQQPFAWEGLKQALRARQIRLESVGQALSLVSTVSLEPEPIPLDVKVVLVGERQLYYLLCELDPEFSELFKVAADFAEEIDWTPKNVTLYARLLAALAKRHALRPLSRRAVARVIERGARLCGDRDKLTVRLDQLADLLREADFCCGQDGARVIDGRHVQRAIEAQLQRHGRVPELLQQQVLRETLRVESEGAQVGQVNGLSVVRLGPCDFGRPSRITASVQLGKGEVIDIEREVQLGGPLHSKGVLILAGFLGARFGQQQPLTLSARLVFEQSYGGVEGDSASSAELYALLSALAELPIAQGLAVTGSVDQRGQVQAIGGINEKIEGFFDLCAARGLTGQQGVLVPAANIKHLMLEERVVAAVKAQRFAIYAVTTIDEGIALLTGMPAGERAADGSFPAGTINGRIEARLRQMAERARRFGAASPPRARRAPASKGGTGRSRRG